MAVDPVYLFLYGIVAVIGLCFGSFATALIYRIPRNIPWVFNAGADDNKACRSACTKCGHTLGARDLVPLFSWLSTRGKCRYCGASVSIRYPLTELVTMLAVLAQFHAWGIGMDTIPVLLMVPFLVAALVIDWEHMILPDSINIALTFLAVVFVACRLYGGSGELIEPVITAISLTLLMVVVSWLMSRWKGRPALGWGDIKFLPAAGLFLGMAALPSYLAVSGALGIATALLKQKNLPKQAFPFGPALIISLYIHVFLTGMGFDYKW